MSEDIEKKKSNYLLELALEEQWEKDTEMKKYEKIEETEPVHVFSKDHEERMREIFKMADEVENRSRKCKRYRQIAAGFVLFFCIITFSITQVEAFRLPFVRFFMELNHHRLEAGGFGLAAESSLKLTNLEVIALLSFF